MTRSLQDHSNAVAVRWFRNTAEPSGELSVGDIVCVGEVPLAVGRIGWTPVHGGLTEVRTCEHGTNPLPEPPPSGDSLPDPAVSTAKEHRDECP
jgi:hypothetical protein